MQLNKQILKEIVAIAMNLIVYFQPEAAIAIALARLVWIVLGELNQKHK